MDTDELKWLGEAPLMAAYRVGHNGKSAAQIGLAAALARGAGKPATSAVRTTATMTAAATAKPKASSALPRDRVKVVAQAVAKDPALKGKAGDAINFLADPALAGVTGEGVIKLLKAGATASPPAMATSAAKPAASPKSDGLWDSAIAKLNGAKPAPLNTSKAASGAWDNVIARMNRANGFTN